MRGGFPVFDTSCCGVTPAYAARSCASRIARSRAFRNLWLAGELGIKYEHVQTDFSDGPSSCRAPAFKAINPNAAVPVITVIGTGFALLISGVVVTESVFNLPGIGRLTVDAVLARDYPVIQAMILLTSGIYVAVNLLIDVAYTLLDPRIRY